MAGAMIEAAREADRFSAEENSDDSNDLDDFEEESSISSLPTDEDDEPIGANIPNKLNNAIEYDNFPEVEESKAGTIYKMKPLPKLQGTKPYQCDICKNSFQQKKSVYRHIKEVHKMTLIFVDDNGNECPAKTTSSFQCEFSGCGLTYPNRKLLAKHENEHRNNKRTNYDSDPETSRPAKRPVKTSARKINGINNTSEQHLPLRSNYCN